MSKDSPNLFETVKTPDPIETLQRLRAEARTEQQREKKAVEAAEAALRIRDDLLKYHQSGWFAHFQRLVEREADYFKVLRHQQPDAAKVIEALYLEAKRVVSESLRHFPAFFEKACAQAGLDIDRTSRHPRYRVCDAFLEVEVLDSSQEVRIADREGLLEQMPCDIGAVIEALQRHKKRLFERKFDAKKFLKRLCNQYQAILQRENLPEGYALPLRRITHRMGKNLKGFRTDEFLVDLSRLVREGPLEVDGRRLDLQHTKDDRQGMLLHGLESRGYVGFISFRKEQNK